MGGHGMFSPGEAQETHVEGKGRWSAGSSAFLPFLLGWNTERQLAGVSRSDVSGLTRENYTQKYPEPGITDRPHHLPPGLRDR